MQQLADILVFDVETDRLLDRAAGESPSDLALTCAVAVDAAGVRVDLLLAPGSEGTAERAAALARFGESLDHARLLCAFNGRGFDLLVLLPLYGKARVEAWAEKLRDPFEVIRALTGTWVKLDELLAANELPVKLADGEKATEWWAAGEHKRVLDYCAEDVRLLRLLVCGRERLRFPVKRWVEGKDARGKRQRVESWHWLEWGSFVRGRG